MKKMLLPALLALAMLPVPTRADDPPGAARAQETYPLKPKPPAKGEKQHMTMRGDLKMAVEVARKENGVETARTDSTGGGRLSVDIAVEIADVSGDSVVSINNVTALDCTMEIESKSRQQGKPDENKKTTKTFLSTLKDAEVEIRSSGDGIASIKDRKGRASPEDLKALQDFAYGSVNE